MRKSFGKKENIIDRVISKFKMAKRGSQNLQSSSVKQEENPEKKQSNDSESSECQEISGVTNLEIENQRVSLDDLPALCEQIEKFIKYIRNVEDLSFLIYKYPVNLKNRFDSDLFELESMLKEINAALTNINKQKAQHSYVKKEKVAIKKTLNKIRDDEFREMEKVVALYDKALFARWENIKSTHRPEVLKSFLTDIKCKQIALENLDTLVTRKLGHLKAYSSLNGKSDKNDKEKSIIPSPLLSICPAPSDNSNQRKSRIPLPPPLPPPPNFAARSNVPNFSGHRRRRSEFEDDFGSDYSLLQDLDDLLEIAPLTFDNVSNNIIVNIDGNDRTENSSSHHSNNDPLTLNDELLAASLQEEMRAVLHVRDDFSHSI